MVTKIKQKEYDAAEFLPDLIEKEAHVKAVEDFIKDYDAAEDIIYADDIGCLWDWIEKNNKIIYRHPSDAKWNMIITLLKYGIMLERNHKKKLL